MKTIATAAVLTLLAFPTLAIAETGGAAAGAAAGGVAGAVVGGPVGAAVGAGVGAAAGDAASGPNRDRVIIEHRDEFGETTTKQKTEC